MAWLWTWLRRARTGTRGRAAPLGGCWPALPASGKVRARPRCQGEEGTAGFCPVHPLLQEALTLSARFALQGAYSLLKQVPLQQPGPKGSPFSCSGLQQTSLKVQIPNTTIFANICHQFGEGNGNPLQYSWPGEFMDRGAWWATVHGVAKSQTRLSD